MSMRKKVNLEVNLKVNLEVNLKVNLKSKLTFLPFFAPPLLEVGQQHCENGI